MSNETGNRFEDQVAKGLGQFMDAVDKVANQVVDEVRKTSSRTSKLKKGRSIWVPVTPGDSVYIVKGGKMEEKVVNEVNVTLKKDRIETFEYVFESDTDLRSTANNDEVFSTAEEAFREYQRQQNAPHDDSGN